MQADGTPMPFDAVIAAAQTVAESEGLSRVLVIDRIEGPMEHEVLGHGGDHSFPGAALSDTNLEDGESGPDMRDKRP